MRASNTNPTMILPTSHTTAVNVARELSRPASKRGGPCQENGCSGQIVARTGATGTEKHVRFLRCNKCNARYGKEIVSPETVFRRSKSRL